MKKRRIWGIGIAFMAVGVVAILMLQGAKPQEVQLSTVEKGTITSFVEENAEAKLTDHYQVFAVSSGLATEVTVEAGQAVKKGDILVRLDEQTTQLHLKDLDAQIKGLNAQYAEAKATVKASDISSLESALRSAQLTYNDLKQTVESSKVLFDSGALSKSDYDKTLSALALQESALVSARSKLKTAKEGLSENDRAQFDAQLLALNAKRELYEKQTNELSYQSPMDGVILTKGIEAGNYIQPGQLLVEIGNVNAVYLTSDILAEDMLGIQVGMKVIITSDQLDIDQGLGKVTWIAPIAFNKLSDLGIMQKRVTVEIELDQQIPVLKSGYEVTVRFVKEEKKDAARIDGPFLKFNQVPKVLHHREMISLFLNQIFYH